MVMQFKCSVHSFITAPVYSSEKTDSGVPVQCQISDKLV